MRDVPLDLGAGLIVADLAYCFLQGVFEVTEKCLAHVVHGKTTLAYRRTDLLDARRAMLQRWALFLEF
jgi:hypothetical protein